MRRTNPTLTGRCGLGLKSERKKGQMSKRLGTLMCLKAQIRDLRMEWRQRIQLFLVTNGGFWISNNSQISAMALVGVAPALPSGIWRYTKQIYFEDLRIVQKF